MKERTVIFWLLRKVYRRIPLLLLLVAADAGSAVLGVMFALGSRGVIDSAVAGDMAAFRNACITQLCVIVGTLVCVTVGRYLRDRLHTELDRDWKRNLLHDLLCGEYAQVSAYHSGELLNRLNNDVRVLDDGLIGVVPGLVSMLVRIMSAVVVLFAVARELTIILVIVGLVAVLCTGFIRRGLKVVNKRVSQADGRVLSFMQEVLERLLVVQAMDLDKEVEKRSENLLKDRFVMQRKRRRASLTANTGVAVMYYLAGFFALGWSAFLLLQGKMSFGTLNAVVQLVNQVQTPFLNLSSVFPQYVAMLAAAERLMELNQIDSYEEKEEDLDACYRTMEVIGADDLSFAYDEEDVLTDTSFAIPKGAFVAITGASGIGKSTLLKLMLGIFKPRAGSLYVRHGGGRIELSRNTRRLFAYVPQGNFLFSGTLRENMLISNPRASQKEIDRAVYISAMDQFLEQLPDGLETVIGENGTGLSEGQVQRLAIARAVLSGAPILLLDEATSSLDARTEQLVLERISALPECTCIAVTHRPAALEIADWKLEVANKTITLIKREKN